MKKLAIQEEVVEIQLQLQFSGEVQALFENPLWKLVLDRIQGAEAEQKNRLATEYLNDYKLGRAQGFLRAARFFTNLRPLDSAEIDRLNAELANLKNELAEITGPLTR